MSARRINVELGPRSYGVVVGDGVLGSIADVVHLPEAAEKAFVVTHPELAHLAGQVAQSLAGVGLVTETIEIPPGEPSKTLEWASGIYERLAGSVAHRHDLIVAVGGGVVTDVTGFVAATYARGMHLVNVPTTLLGQVDAAIG
ncbi:MAG TPA: iron-containing alcohol dehydrogenase, partial [Actinomycetota bacterium]|nr:iron-containing alcohol dehydrogenase [Actinomycetota bacterium]